MKKFAVLACTTALAQFAVATPSWSEILIGSVLSTTGPAAFLGEPERERVMELERRLLVGGV